MIARNVSTATSALRGYFSLLKTLPKTLFLLSFFSLPDETVSVFGG
jgi:hypothetical protein